MFKDIPKGNQVELIAFVAVGLQIVVFDVEIKPFLSVVGGVIGGFDAKGLPATILHTFQENASGATHIKHFACRLATFADGEIASAAHTALAVSALVPGFSSSTAIG